MVKIFQHYYWLSGSKTFFYATLFSNWTSFQEDVGLWVDNWARQSDVLQCLLQVPKGKSSKVFNVSWFDVAALTIGRLLCNSGIKVGNFPFTKRQIGSLPHTKNCSTKVCSGNCLKYFTMISVVNVGTKCKYNIATISIAGRILVPRVTALVVEPALCPWMMERATRQTRMRWEQ